MKYERKIFGKCIGGSFQENLKDEAEVFYLYPTEKFPTPKLSIKFTSSSPKQEFEKPRIKSFRCKATHWSDMSPMRELIKLIASALGYAYGVEVFKHLENFPGDKDLEAKDRMEMMAGNLGSQIINSFKNGFLEARK